MITTKYTINGTGEPCRLQHLWTLRRPHNAHHGSSTGSSPGHTGGYCVQNRISNVHLFRLSGKTNTDLRLYHSGNLLGTLVCNYKNPVLPKTTTCWGTLKFLFYTDNGKIMLLLSKLIFLGYCLARRRQEENTTVFKDRYRWRADAEATMSQYDCFTGVKRLRGERFQHCTVSSGAQGRGRQSCPGSGRPSGQKKGPRSRY
jgi:hypothetical protein